MIIWADRDASQAGQEAAIELMDRLRAEGRHVVVFLPPYHIPKGKKGIDWDDVVRSLGLNTARTHTEVVKLRRKIEAKISSYGVDPATILRRVA